MANTSPLMIGCAAGFSGDRTDAEIRALAEKSKANGPKTAERADQLLQRLSP